jgi:soluble lytic murein transglycosylase
LLIVLKKLLPVFALLVISLILFLRTPHFARLYYPYLYREVIETNADAFGLDPLLLAAVTRTESKFDPRAVSRKGALGLMQIMPATAEWIAPRLGVGDFRKEMLFDPETNIRFGSWYLADLKREFGGRLDVVIVAYNAGRGKVSGWLADGVWSGNFDDKDNIPYAESRVFLARVRHAYAQYIRLYK